MTLRTAGMGTGRKLTSILLFIIGTMASLATILGFAGSMWWGWDRIADWRFPLLVVLVVTSVVYGFGFRRAASALFLLAAIVNAVLLAPLWLSTQATAASSDRIRFVSLDTSGSDGDANVIAEWIHSVEADIALLYRTNGEWADVLETAGLPYRILPATAGADALGPPIVLVRGDTRATAVQPLPGSDVTLRLELGATQLTVAGLAVLNPGSTLEADQRIARFAAVNAAATGLTDPVVVTGNFETSRWSYAFDTIADGLSNSEDGFGYAATWPRFDPPIVGTYVGLPLDHALYSGTITVPARRVGPDLGSAHRPLLFDVSPTAG